MSLLVPYHRGYQHSRSWTNERPANTTGVTVTGASAHTVGTIVEVFAATTHDTYWLKVALSHSFVANAQTDQLLNIYVGSSGNEKVIIPNLVAGWSSNIATGVPPRSFEFPLFIPAGARVSASLQSLVVNDTVEVLMELWGGGTPHHWAGTMVECIGANTAASQGTSVTPGGASEGTFTIIGTAQNTLRYILPMIQGNFADTTITTAGISVDLGVGDATYQDLEEFSFSMNGSEITVPNSGGRGRFTNVPAGTVLQLRAQNSSASVEPNDYCIYGVY
jgi:hypothetical protein